MESRVNEKCKRGINGVTPKVSSMKHLKNAEVYRRDV